MRRDRRCENGMESNCGGMDEHEGLSRQAGSGMLFGHFQSPRRRAFCCIFIYLLVVSFLMWRFYMWSLWSVHPMFIANWRSMSVYMYISALTSSWVICVCVPPSDLRVCVCVCTCFVAPPPPPLPSPSPPPSKLCGCCPVATLPVLVLFPSVTQNLASVHPQASPPSPCRLLAALQRSD